MTWDPALAKPALAAMRGVHIAVIGDLVLDQYIYGQTVRVSREAPVPVVRQEYIEYRLGGLANTAANVAALGARVSVLGAVGQDEGGVRLREALAKASVATEGVLSTARATPVKTRVLAGAFGTLRQQVLRLDTEPTEELAPATEEALMELVRGHACDALVVSDYGLRTVTPRLVDAVRARAASGLPVLPVLVDSRSRLAEFVGITAVTPNVPEAEALTGHALHTQAAVDAAGPEILAKLRCPLCLITQGRGGMTLFRGGDSPLHVDVVGPQDVTDVTGAGDTVMAVFATSLAAGVDPVTAMHLANLAAGFVVQKVGTAVATPADILGMLK